MNLGAITSSIGTVVGLVGTMFKIQTWWRNRRNARRDRTLRAMTVAGPDPKCNAMWAELLRAQARR